MAAAGRAKRERLPLGLFCRCDRVSAHRITEALRFDGHEDAPILDRLLHLQKRLKYGAKTRQAVILHEAGFADRVVADELAEIAGPRAVTKGRLRFLLRIHHARVEKVLAVFPSYYSFVWDKVLRGGRRRL